MPKNNKIFQPADFSPSPIMVKLSKILNIKNIYQKPASIHFHQFITICDFFAQDIAAMITGPVNAPTINANITTFVIITYSPFVGSK